MPSTAVRPEPGHDVVDLVVDGVHRPEAVAEAGQALDREGERLAVAVDADDRRAREAVEHALGVPAHAERRVDVHAALPLEGGGQQLEDAVAHDGDVPVASGTTVAPSSVVRCVGLVPSVGHDASFTFGGCVCGAGGADVTGVTGVTRNRMRGLRCRSEGGGEAVALWVGLVGCRAGETCGRVPIRYGARDGGSRLGCEAAGGRLSGLLFSVVRARAVRAVVRSWLRAARQKRPGMTSSAVSAKLCSVCSR